MIEFVTFKGKIIGHINSERKVYLSRREEKHFFHLFAGFGISVKVLDLLQTRGIENIEIEFEGKTLKTTVSSFISNGIDWRDETSGKIEDQLILPIEGFKKEEKHGEIQNRL